MRVFEMIQKNHYLSSQTSNGSKYQFTNKKMKNKKQFNSLNMKTMQVYRYFFLNRNVNC